MSEYIPLPQPHELSQQEKEDAMGAYLMMFASTALGLPFPLLNLIAAIVYYSINQKKNRFVKFHALQSLLSQLPVSLLNSAAVIWLIVKLVNNDFVFTDIYKGFVAMLVIVNIVYFVFSLIAAFRARKGLMYYFLFFGEYSYHVTFLERPGEDKLPENKPPNF